MNADDAIRGHQSDGNAQLFSSSNLPRHEHLARGPGDQLLVADHLAVYRRAGVVTE
jgi:hypothetical protein